MPDMPSNPHATPPVRDRRTPPPGILSRNTQTLVLGAVAAVMVAVIGLSGRNAPKDKPTVSSTQAAGVVDPNAARIQEYENRIEDQTRKVQAEQAQLMRSQQALGATPRDSAGTST
jgi:hypothetical protein